MEKKKKKTIGMKADELSNDTKIYEEMDYVSLWNRSDDTLKMEFNRFGTNAIRLHKINAQQRMDIDISFQKCSIKINVDVITFSKWV